MSLPTRASEAEFTFSRRDAGASSDSTEDGRRRSPPVCFGTFAQNRERIQQRGPVSCRLQAIPAQLLLNGAAS